MMGLQAKSIESQIALNNAQASKINAETEKTEAVHGLHRIHRGGYPAARDPRGGDIMTAHERVEQSRRDQFYEGVRSVLFELIPLCLKVAVLLALASVLCGMCQP